MDHSTDARILRSGEDWREGGEVTPEATHRREGETGYNVCLEGTMGVTLRTQTI